MFGRKLLRAVERESERARERESESLGRRHKGGVMERGRERELSVVGLHPV